MISDEGQRRAAAEMSSAADSLVRAVNNFTDAVHTLNLLFGQGYGSNIDQLIDELRRFNERAASATEGGQP